MYRYPIKKGQENRLGTVPCMQKSERSIPVARSAFMRAEEIDEERARSGWNPYQGEEEIMEPYFVRQDYGQILEEQKSSERDLRMLQSMYPDAAKMILPYIEEECDKMEYEGSPMYDEHPDATTVWQIQDRILSQVRGRLQEEPEAEEEPEAILSMQYQGNRGGRPGRNWPGDLIRVLLLQEMHHRRCRHRGCRRGWQ